MEITEFLASYSGIMAKLGQMGKVKTNLLNKKNTAAALERWQSIPADEIARLDQEIGSAEVINKSIVFTQTALLYNAVGVLNIVPVKDIVWMYPHVVTQRMNFIPYNKMHQLYIMERSGEMHNIQIAQTGGFSKKQPAVDFIDKFKATVDPVRPGIVYGFSDDANRLFHQNLQQAVEMVDQRSGL